MNALYFKNFCNKNLTEVSWARIIIKNYQFLKEKDINYDSILNPSDSLVLDNETILVLNKTLQDLYNIEVEEINYL